MAGQGWACWTRVLRLLLGQRFRIMGEVEVPQDRFFRSEVGELLRKRFLYPPVGMLEIVVKHRQRQSEGWGERLGLGARVWVVLLVLAVVLEWG